ncbi:MAG: 2'-5' RNA ligase family protein [Alcaligenaceae bacterium]|nr:MAG: 2'-5' RNA ligase family protein [Alcaligenaceae bacterium]
MPQSALIVRVPEAEPHVSHYREQYDPSAKLGVPAHITVLYPFLPPELINSAILEKVQAAISCETAFPFHLATVGRFPGVVYLNPEPSDPFVSLTRAITQAFPDYPPYRGQHAGTVPHLTAAQTGEPEQGAVAAELHRLLENLGSIVSSCNELVLIENSTGRWEQMHVFCLAPSPPTDA